MTSAAPSPTVTNTTTVVPQSTNATPSDPNVMPYFAPRSTQARLRGLTTGVYDVSSTSYMYILIDALTGSSGAGALKQELMISRFQSNLFTTYFGDLDNVYGDLIGMPRLAVETYTYNPTTDLLTSDQWDEVRTCDANYRARISSFFQAMQAGGTPIGLTLMTRAATGFDSHIYETWKSIDLIAEGLTPPAVFGRLGVNIRNEVVIQPLTTTLTVSALHELNALMERIKPRETVITIDINGLAIHTPIQVNAVSASDSYFQVEKNVTGVPDLANLPPTEVLASDVNPQALWMQPGFTVQAPYAAFNNSQESAVYYLYSDGSTTPIDSVTYSTATDDSGTLTPTSNYVQQLPNSNWGPWVAFPLADSPDNYPGGEFGQTPLAAPALTASGQSYSFPWTSQAAFVASLQNQISAQGGQFNTTSYRLPITKLTSSRTFDPTLAIPTTVPVKDSTVTTNWIRRGTPSALTAANT
jgi:hypothetical protein